MVAVRVTYNYVSAETALTVVIMSEEFIQERLRSVYSAGAKYGLPYLDDSKNNCDTMADNKGHGLIPTENGKLFHDKINTLKRKRRLLYLKTQFVPRSKHFSSRL